MVIDAFSKAGIIDIILGLFGPVPGNFDERTVEVQAVTAEEANREPPPSDEESLVLDKFEELSSDSESEN